MQVDLKKLCRLVGITCIVTTLCCIIHASIKGHSYFRPISRVVENCRVCAVFDTAAFNVCPTPALISCYPHTRCGYHVFRSARRTGGGASTCASLKLMLIKLYAEAANNFGRS